MSGALTERDFVKKLERAGFVDIEIVDRKPMTLEDCRDYPLFTPDLLELMERLIPDERRDHVAVAIVTTARLG